MASTLKNAGRFKDLLSRALLLVEGVDVDLDKSLTDESLDFSNPDYLIRIKAWVWSFNPKRAKPKGL